MTLLPLPSLISVVEQFPSPALLLDDDGRVLGASPAAQGVLGREPLTGSHDLEQRLAGLQPTPKISRSRIRSEAGDHELIGLCSEPVAGHAPRDVAALAGSVAHDFNNLLGVIINFTTLAAGNLPPDSPAAQDLREVLAASSRATEITKELLQLGRNTR